MKRCQWQVMGDRWRLTSGRWPIAGNMRQKLGGWWWILTASLMIALLAPILSPLPAQADPPPEHQYIQAYTGAETCAVCHLDMSDEVMHSVHYTWDKKLDHYSPIPASIPRINWLGVLNPELQIAGGCGRCHVGGGPMPGTPAAETPAAKNQIDCLICHAEVYDMNARYPQRNEEGEWTLQGDVSLAAARSAAKPTAEACLRCHLNAGGGKLYKRGVDFAPVADRHAPSSTGDVHADQGMVCVDCHRGEDHKVYGYAPTLWSRDYQERLTCEQCHTDTTHVNPLINQKHTRLDCRTCHIRQTGGLMSRDWTAKPVFDPITELYGPVDEVAPANSVAPIYKWYNGGVLKDGHWPGSIEDENARLQPFKLFTGVAPVDSDSGRPLPLKLAIFYKTGDLQQAIAVGAREAGVAFSGSWRAKTMQVPLQISHGILPKEEAMTCIDCHVQGGALDFMALGYSQEKAALLSSLATPGAEQPRILQVKFASGAQPLATTAVDQPDIETPEALELSWSPMGVAVLVLAVLVVTLAALFKLKKDVQRASA